MLSGIACFVGLCCDSCFPKNLCSVFVSDKCISINFSLVKWLKEYGLARGQTMSMSFELFPLEERGGDGFMLLMNWDEAVLYLPMLLDRELEGLKALLGKGTLYWIYTCKYP